jgi:hypothetical protein
MLDYNHFSMRRGCLWITLALLGNLWFTGLTCGQTPTPTVRIEADWELVLNTPDAASDSPQIVCVLSPTDNVHGIYAAFELNQQSLPSFSPGGMQLQLWDGETPLAESNHVSGVQFQNAGETVAWTQIMELKNGALRFEVRNGRSTTWGDFGALGTLEVSTPSSLENLNGFNMDVSLNNSGVNFGGNHVLSLTLKRLRYIKANGEVQEQEVNHNINQSQ